VGLLYNPTFYYCRLTCVLAAHYQFNDVHTVARALKKDPKY
jgi:hypothetical protein